MDFYHFTDSRNIESIRHYGLLSWRRLEWQGIAHYPGSNALSRSLDSRRGLQDFVRLTLQPYHPMLFQAQREGRVGNCVWIKVSGLVINRSTNLYSDDNATANRANIDHYPETAILSGCQQAEVLVQGNISPEYIYFPAKYC